jgi:four helix bundle suffix protein
MFVDRLGRMDGLYSIGSLEKQRFHDSFICLMNQANHVLDRQLKQLEAAFLKEGGLRERMTRARLESRKKGHHDA